MAKKSSDGNPFDAVQAAYDVFKQQEAAKTAADAAYHEAVTKANADHEAALASASASHDAVVKDYTEALANLRAVQAHLNEMLGNVTADPRFRQSA